MKDDDNIDSDILDTLHGQVLEEVKALNAEPQEKIKINFDKSFNNIPPISNSSKNSSDYNSLINNFNKYSKFILLGICTLVFLIVIGYSISISNNTVTTIDINFGENVYTHKSYIYIYGKNGIKILKDDNIILEDKFSIENPYVVTCEDKIAIGDKNGKIIRVYSSTEQLYTLDFTNSILGFNINKNGYISVITKVNESYGIDVHNENGVELYTIKDISLNEGIPVSSAISHDNRVLSVSYLNIYDPNVSSNIVLYSMSNNMAFGGYTKKNQIVSNLNFSSDNNLIGISGKELFIVKINTSADNPSSREAYQNTFVNKIKYIEFLDLDNFVVCYGAPILGEDSSIENNTLVFYNSSGSERGKYISPDDIMTLEANEYGVIISNSRLFRGISTSGSKIWEYQATQDIKKVLYYQSKNNIVITTNNTIKITRINKTLFDADITSIEQDQEQAENNSSGIIIDFLDINDIDDIDNENIIDKNNIDDVEDVEDVEDENGDDKELELESESQ
ncbi:MAG: DUF5711 family protein [bacterium]